MALKLISISKYLELRKLLLAYWSPYLIFEIPQSNLYSKALALFFFTDVNLTKTLPYLKPFKALFT